MQCDCVIPTGRHLTHIAIHSRALVGHATWTFIVVEEGSILSDSAATFVIVLLLKAGSFGLVELNDSATVNGNHNLPEVETPDCVCDGYQHLLGHQ
jgi:hypothetical protein